MHSEDAEQGTFDATLLRIYDRALCPVDSTQVFSDAHLNKPDQIYDALWLTVWCSMAMHDIDVALAAPVLQIHPLHSLPASMIDRFSV